MHSVTYPSLERPIIIPWHSEGEKIEKNGCLDTCGVCAVMLKQLSTRNKRPFPFTLFLSLSSLFSLSSHFRLFPFVCFFPCTEQATAKGPCLVGAGKKQATAAALIVRALFTRLRKPQKGEKGRKQYYCPIRIVLSFS